MLIDIARALDEYDVSRSTIMRRLKAGTLTKHTAEGGGVIRLDTNQLDRSFARRVAFVPDQSDQRDEAEMSEETVSFIPDQMLDRLVPSPVALQAALDLTQHSSWVLPRLWARRTSA